MEAIKAILLGLTGTAFGLVFYGFAFLSLPFCMVALMHLWGFEWWTALILALLMNVVPLLGQAAYVIFAMMGAYYFYDAGFSWHRSTTASIKTFDVEKMSDSDFAKYKKTVIHPAMIEGCLREGKKKLGFDDKVPAHVATFCDCFVGVAEAYVTPRTISVGPLPEQKVAMEREVSVRCAK
jgi:hypothetical protein